MTKALEIVKPEQAVAFAPDEIKILKETIMPGATDAELSLFGKVCAQTGLSPFARQIFPVSRMVWNRDIQAEEKKWSFQTSVDGFRLVAQRSKEYEGQTVAQWCGEDGIWKDVWFSQDFPKAARVGVYRKNFREPLYAVAVWDSYVQKYLNKKTNKETIGNMWSKMPELMLAKCAECLALRKAFPQELSGVYSTEEMAQADSTPPAPGVIPATYGQPEHHNDEGEYILPFGYAVNGSQLKGMSIDRIVNKIGVADTENMVLRFTDILSGKEKSKMVMTDQRKADLQEFIDTAEVFLKGLESPDQPELMTSPEFTSFDQSVARIKSKNTHPEE